MDEDYLTFEDLEVPDAESPTAARRGSPDDPIRIQTEGRRPTVTIGEPVVAGAGGAGRGRPSPPVDVDGDDDAPPPPPRDRQQAIQVGVGVAIGALVIFLLGGFVAAVDPAAPRHRRRGRFAGRVLQRHEPGRLPPAA